MKVKVTKRGESILLAVFILVALGVVMIYSASAMYADRFYQDSAYFLKKQLLFVATGLVALFFCMHLPAKWIKENSRLLLGCAALFLLTVYLPVIGKSGGGARRWIHFFNFSIQPVEFAKIAVCAYLADYLTRKNKKIEQGSLTVFFPPMALVGGLALIVVLQPDLGSVIFMLLITLSLFFVSGIKLRYIIAAAALIAPLLGILVMIEPYRMARVVSFLNPWNDPRGSGFQIIQSFVALGHGGWTGVGLGASTQKLFYLPQSYTDFIFAIIGEELGLAGTFAVIALFVFILIQGAAISEKGRDSFSRLFAYALTLLITLQAIINILVATGMVPTKGLPLPFVSYGGSSLVFNLAAVGLLVGLDRQPNS